MIIGMEILFICMERFQFAILLQSENERMYIEGWERGGGELTRDYK